MRRFQRLLFVQIATEAGFKSQSFPIESHINMPSFIALKSMFTAWYKELFQPLWIVSPFIIILNEIHLDTKVWGVAALIARWPEIGSWSWFKSASDQTLSTTLSHYTGSLLCLCCRCLLEQVLTHNLRLCPFSCQWIQSNYDHVNKTHPSNWRSLLQTNHQLYLSVVTITTFFIRKFFKVVISFSQHSLLISTFSCLSLITLTCCTSFPVQALCQASASPSLLQCPSQHKLTISLFFYFVCLCCMSSLPQSTFFIYVPISIFLCQLPPLNIFVYLLIPLLSLLVFFHLSRRYSKYFNTSAVLSQLSGNSSLPPRACLNSSTSTG